MTDEKVLLRRLAVQERFENYAANLDALDWEGFLDCFVDEADYRVISRENADRGLPLAAIRCESKDMLRDRVRSIQETMMYEPRYVRHLVSGVRVTEHVGDVLQAQANYCVFETLVDEPTRVLQVGRYEAEIDWGGETRRFRRLHCIFDSVLVPNSLIYPV